jgi:hypothetical protein
MKRPPHGELTSSTDASSQRWQDSSDAPERSVLVRGHRLADLIRLDLESSELLDELRHIHWSARQVIDNNLGNRTLERSGLERLQASVLRQAEQAKNLQASFAHTGASPALKDEIAELCRFFDNALNEIAQQLKPAH